jgi:hypothetical protein
MSPGLDLGAKSSQNGRGHSHMLYDMMENHVVVTSIRDIGVARTVRADLVKRVHLGHVTLGIVVVLDIRARIVATGDPVFGRTWRVVAAPDVQNTEARPEESVPGIKKFRGADMHSDSQWSGPAFEVG